MNVYAKNLIQYVMHHGGKTEEQAIWYLDENCAWWRLGEPPKANKIEVEATESEE